MKGTMNMATLVTVVIGLILTDLFASVHRLIRHRRRVRWHWLPLLVAWYVLNMVLKNWWGLVFNNGGVVQGGGWLFLFYGHLFFLLYLLAAATLPDEVPQEGLDLLQTYLDNRRHFWGLYACVSLVLLVWAVVHPALTGSSWQIPVILSNLVMLGIELSLAWTRRFAYHATVVSLLAVGMVMEIFIKFH